VPRNSRSNLLLKPLEICHLLSVSDVRDKRKGRQRIYTAAHCVAGGAYCGASFGSAQCRSVAGAFVRQSCSASDL